jgi:response regulator RpfG family c-di-GMP phosphodiesterase
VDDVQRDRRDIQDQLAEHIKATKERARLAHKAMALFEAGKIEEARTALNKADEWDLKLRTIEAAHRRKQP